MRRAMGRERLRFCHTFSLFLSCFCRGEKYSSGAMYIFLLISSLFSLVLMLTYKEIPPEMAALVIMKGDPGLKLCWYMLYPAPSWDTVLCCTTKACTASSLSIFQNHSENAMLLTSYWNFSQHVIHRYFHTLRNTLFLESREFYSFAVVVEGLLLW